MKTYAIDYVERFTKRGRLARTIRKTVKARDKWSAESKGHRLCPKGYSLWVIEEV